MDNFGLKTTRKTDFEIYNTIYSRCHNVYLHEHGFDFKKID